jgi:peptidyl-dipeptidase Dcp
VELPSQLYENWQERPEVLQKFARHYKTGEPLPEDLLRRFLAARKFNQGFSTVEYVANALIDFEFHSQPSSAASDVRAFERKELDRIGMPEEIALRHRPTQFGHIFSGDHYAAGYYSYMWSEVMDADAFGAFEEVGDVFDPAIALRLLDNIYASGGSRDPEEAYVAFRGRKPKPEALLRRRGLLDTSAAASELLMADTAVSPSRQAAVNR